MKKAILIPSDIAQVIKPVDDTLKSLDSEMLNMISNQELPLDLKMIKYNQILQRYNFLQTERNKPYKVEIEESHPILMKTFDHILEGIPKKQLHIAKSLLDFISKQQNIQVESNGELTINGMKINNSNIVDLIHDLVRDRKTHPAPAGIKQVAKALKQANIPLEYIGNKNRLYYFQQEHQSPQVRQLFENSAQYMTPRTPPPIRPRSWME